jgi:hypothetical protein
MISSFFHSFLTIFFADYLIFLHFPTPNCHFAHWIQKWHNPKNCPFGFNTTIHLKPITTISNYNGKKRGMFQLNSVPALSDVVVIFFNSIVVLIPNAKFLGCANIAFSERHNLRLFSFLNYQSTFLWLVLSMVIKLCYYNFYLS